MGLGAVLLLSAAWFWLIRRMIVRPLKQASHMAYAIADGDLTLRVHSDRHDEIGHLLEAMNTTSTGLTRVVGSVNEQAHSVAWPARKSPRATRTWPPAPKAKPARWSRPPPPWKSWAPPWPTTRTTRNRPTASRARPSASSPKAGRPCARSCRPCRA
ncbi:HAMP domain-containing protein [Delftia tsuruhatensis]